MILYVAAGQSWSASSRLLARPSSNYHASALSQRQHTSPVGNASRFGRRWRSLCQHEGRRAYLSSALGARGPQLRTLRFVGSCRPKGWTRLACRMALCPRPIRRNDPSKRTCAAKAARNGKAVRNGQHPEEPNVRPHKPVPRGPLGDGCPGSTQLHLPSWPASTPTSRCLTLLLEIRADRRLSRVGVAWRTISARNAPIAPQSSSRPKLTLMKELD
jgi:hypothetical protein